MTEEVDNAHSALLDCPFCGGAAVVTEFPEGVGIECERCGARVSDGDIKIARIVWNMRKSCSWVERVL